MLIKLIRWFDRYILSVIVILLSIGSRNKPLRNKPKKILIVKLWALGDSVLSLPLIKAIHEMFPIADIDVLCSERNEVIYTHSNYVDNVITHINLERKYDLVFDLEPYLNISAIISYFKGKTVVGFSHSVRSYLYNHTVKFNKKQHMVENYLDMIRGLGWEGKGELVKLKYSRQDKNDVETFIKYNKVKKLVGIAPAVAETAKERMWDMNKFVELGNYLKSKGYQIMLIGSEADMDILISIKNKIDGTVFLSYQYVDLPKLFCLMEKMEFVISNDSGPMHIAAAQGTKTIGLFGPNTPTLWGPYGEGNIGLTTRVNFKCMPCIDNTTGKVKRCKDNGLCMRKLKLKRVIEVVDKWIKK